MDYYLLSSATVSLLVGDKCKCRSASFFVIRFFYLLNTTNFFNLLRLHILTLSLSFTTTLTLLSKASFSNILVDLFNAPFYSSNVTSLIFFLFTSFLLLLLLLQLQLILLFPPILHRTRFTPRRFSCSVWWAIDIIRRHPESMPFPTLPQQFIPFRSIIHAETCPTMAACQCMHVIHCVSARLVRAMRTPGPSPADVTGWGPPGVIVCAAPKQTFVGVPVAGREDFATAGGGFGLHLR